MPNKKYSKFLIVLLHLGFWLALYLVPFFDPRGVHAIHTLTIDFFLDPHIIVNHLFFIFLFYSNSVFYVPFFLLQKRKVFQYVLVVFISLCLILIFSYFLFPFYRLPMIDGGHRPHLPPFPILRLNQTLSLLFPLLFILLISLLYRLLVYKYNSDKILKDKENEKLKTELSFLRSQISPHFIFNALNSSIILVRKQSEKAEDSLMKLASLMRYMLYETDSEKITIGDELEYIQNYVDLQKIRFEKTVKISTSINVEDIFQNEFVESMLLIPFIENAFKHGTLVLKEPFIDVNIYSKENKLILETKNKFTFRTNDHGQVSKNHGIGLSNVKRRLELLYPERHELNLTTDGEYFNVYLAIKIN
jgi:two-component system LytT family sensor kinase